MAGRKTDLTPEIQQRICASIAEGNYVEVACQAAGVGKSTFYRWMEQGEKAKSGPFREFWDAVKRAEAEAEQKRVKTIITAATKNWQAAAWWLERKHNDRWGQKRQVQVAVERELEKALDELREKLPSDAYRQVLAALAAEEDSEE